ncbi:alpha/beta fold hydrolase [Roseateles sp. BYS180W]|uniref:Alpha/beta fold hydrolase n=1 Tax=Roseateles rivi TaxID=3299028 RepID=A0ABW7FY51_9BURK
MPPRTDPAHQRPSGVVAVAVWRMLGLMLLGLALCAMAFRAPQRDLTSLVPRWAPAPSDFIELRLPGTSTPQLLHVRDQGPAGARPPLLLLHGLGSSLHSWEGWVAQLQGRYRVITVDLPGLGLSGPSPQGRYSTEEDLNFITALMAQLKLDRVVLGGHSLGAQLAWQFAAKHPERVEALVLVNGGWQQPSALQHPPIGFQLLGLDALLSPLLNDILPRPLLRQTLQQLWGDPSAVSSELVQRHYELIQRQGHREALRQRWQVLRANPSEPSTVSQTPTLILWGERDTYIPQQATRDLTASWPHSRWHTFAHLGHMPQEEDPRASVEPVLEFLHSLKP